MINGPLVAGLVSACLLTGCTGSLPVRSESAVPVAGSSARTGSPAASPTLGGGALPPDPEIATGYRAGLRSVVAQHSAAVAAHPLASEAGATMLRRGGSAVDAALAMQAMLTLVEPQSSGIGGGALLMIHDGQDVHAIDGRETAPAGATERLFVDEAGRPIGFRAAQLSGLSVGVPGALRALELAHRRFGRLSWAEAFEPAITAAESGFAMPPRLHRQLLADPQARTAALARPYLDADGQVLPIGATVRHVELASTLRQIARHGADALYRGPIAEAIVATVRGAQRPGTLSLADLSTYRAVPRAPLCSDYRDWRICGMPPPSSGGLAIAQILGMLQAIADRDATLALAAHPPTTDSRSAAGLLPSPIAVHLISEAQRLAFADRDRYVADPDHVAIDVNALSSPAYLAQRSALIGARSLGRATPGDPAGQRADLASDPSPPRTATSQAVAVDARGQAVSMTTTIESAFGSHLSVAGFVLNNQLTDFSFVPRVDDRPVANRVGPGKRPRSSMSPTLIFDRRTGTLVAALGSVGGSQIVGYVTKAVVGLLDWRLDVQQAINLPNFGSRNGPTELESGMIPPDWTDALRERGHAIRLGDMNSGTQAIVRDPLHDAGGPVRWRTGVDPRRDGAAVVD